MQFTAEQIAQIIGARVEGNPQTVVSGFGKIEEAKEGELSFLSNPKYEDFLYTTGASLVIVSEDLVLKQPVTATLLRAKDSYAAFAILLNAYAQMRTSHLKGIEDGAFVHPNAKIGENVYIARFAYISAGATIGDNTVIYPGVFIGEKAKIGTNCVVNSNVSVYHDCIIGNNAIIHAGAVIGSDGFGFAPNPDGTYSKIPQIGIVIVGNNVEIGANTCIDRSTMGATVIKDGVKLDNLVQIAHNAEIGENTALAALSGISGSTKLGKNVIMGGQSGTVGHIHIADFTKVNAQSGVNKSITKPNTSVTGTPAYDYMPMIKAQVTARSLPEMEKRLKTLELELAELKNSLSK
ncbi:MAG: UDP-3-O-(3-hydroxymyristoyl)glucosamine N-acyltransferase [Pseudopedobacter saltans]|uniref:UDP-3-O-acylglucosamine N-acyltransferase n=1 Tax=Pseudopedobacter saltans TaxID=151895 RepID=A0A2W5H4P7_9SPHI|nr:MAG: UDP-3-O-(3-hydroxymyristoyl)glucosamine N-acyltransferase [Pseudopedobacter saltans]